MEKPETVNPFLCQRAWNESAPADGLFKGDLGTCAIFETEQSDQ